MQNAKRNMTGVRTDGAGAAVFHFSFFIFRP
jgi:hypothetical protein